MPLKEYYKIKLEVLSPIHIGCDDFFTPIEFVIDENKLIVFSIFDLLSNLTQVEREELKKITEQKGINTLIQLYRFYAYRIKEKIKKLSNKRIYTIPNELARRYEEVLKFTNNREILKNFNKFEIPRTFFNPNDNQPIIPGSSVKGALRTGYLDYLLKKYRVELNQNGPQKTDHLRKLKDLLDNIEKINENTERRDINEFSKKLEENLLNYRKIAEDPFNLIKISDLVLKNEVKTQILYQININKTEGRLIGRLSLPIEVIPCGSIFEGILSIEDQRVSSHQIKSKLLFEELLNHHKSILKKETDLAKRLNFKQITFTNAHLQALKEKQAFLLKLGKHSGAEAVTLEGIRKILIRKRGGRKEYKDSPTTIWLASNSKTNINEALPFGWAIIYLEPLKC